MSDLLLVRYGELALKSPPVRREFENRLKHNLLEGFLREKRECTLSADHGHLYVQTADAEAAVPIVRRTFGVVSVSPARVVPSELASILPAVADAADVLLPPRARFAVRARRTGSHSFTSQSLGAAAGAAILERYAERELKVDLTHPEVEIHVEVRGPRTYLYTQRASGPGGLPLGVGGKVGALVDGPRGALGTFLLMKRGCRAYPLCFGAGEPLVHDVLQVFDPRIVLEGASDKAAAWAALKERAVKGGWDGVVLDLSVEEHAAARDFFGETVIFSPTVGLSDEEVARRWSDVVALLQ
ncbi:MAG: hypothetical protein KGJ23_02460 [Euryarchaeota archaeon]|nr:hypothetical protein [Euryarchaeota archaeon]MDE2046315.1 hypothetical protein [Thermoplasmata archaeon]